MQLRAFLFSVDAVLALAMLSFIPISLALLSSQQPETRLAAPLQQLGYDYLANGAPLAAEAGVSFAAQPPEGAWSVRAVRFEHPGFCSPSGPDSQCLHGFDANASSYAEVFVS